MPISKISRSTETKTAFFFYHRPWKRHEIKETLIRELNWKKPEESVSSWRFDCHIHSLVNSLYVSLLGCTKDCFCFCNMINEGNMTREEALCQEEKLIARTFSKKEREILVEKIHL